ncbi:hypothetical protein GNP94_00570 [Paenibacillus campinasensis]|uniref:Uncharacterized protein n=1 Tax=Paenibacillus campinasensis TaxID=66347 RepID=A0ABW9SVV9_9BACL|nr:hypothetical protein [Paenibacillus campinasensis]MUG64496.1 hypothetical protein [Paenibacillus campinasensis]
MSNKKVDYEGQFPGVHPVPESDHPEDHAATDMLDDLVQGVLENEDAEEIRSSSNEATEQPKSPNSRSSSRKNTQ